jgi:aminomethyltransferase
MELDGPVPELPTPILCEGQAIGEMTSVAEIALADGQKRLALGMVRNEALARNLPLTYASGTVRAMDAKAVASLWKALRDYAGQEAAAH